MPIQAQRGRSNWRIIHKQSTMFIIHYLTLPLQGKRMKRDRKTQ
ncbi:hypothetical protein FOFC_15293 [Fusarium oxysporum]|nr:hypothetical protein FOFC_15293 [Fusarium oxysporum]